MRKLMVLAALAGLLSVAAAEAAIFKCEGGAQGCTVTRIKEDGTLGPPIKFQNGEQFVVHDGDYALGTGWVRANG